MDQGAGPSRVVVEADGGSRGNPGPAAYGALLRDPESGAVLAETAEAIGTATNNVAEYRGLIAGLRLAAERAPGASIEVRMDSQLVVEQMSGRWKVKHPAMRPLAAEAAELAPAGTVFTWIPRERNADADRLVNLALDGAFEPAPDPAPGREATAPVVAQAPARGWSAPADGETSTVVLVRHGVTDHTAGKLFSGGLGGADPALNDDGRDQVRATGRWLSSMAGEIDAVVTSPVRRAEESAGILAGFLDHPVRTEPGFAEMEFGHWEGLTFAEVRERYPDELEAWIGDPAHPAGGGDSFRSLQQRVLEARDRLLAEYSGRSVVVVSHVTPIKVLVADALGAELDALFRMELAPASVTVIAYYADPDGRVRAHLRLFNGRPVAGLG